MLRIITCRTLMWCVHGQSDRVNTTLHMNVAISEHTRLTGCKRVGNSSSADGERTVEPQTEVDIVQQFKAGGR